MQQAIDYTLEQMAQDEKEYYDSLPIHQKFLNHFWEHQWCDWEYWEIDCWFEWKYEEDIPNIHEISDWIESELKALWDGWIESSTKPKEWFYLTYNTIWAIFETYYHPHTWWCTWWSIKETEITHYQPLINPPNK